MSTQGIQLLNENYLAWLDVKDPQATKDYELDFVGDSNGGFLQGQVINAVMSVTVDPLSGLIVGDGSNGAPAPSTDGSRIIFWLIAGGELGNWEILTAFTIGAGNYLQEITRVIQVANT